MPQRQYKQIPLDPALREKALQIIAVYQKESTTPASDSTADRLTAMVPAAMNSIADLIHAHDRGELPVAVQRQLATTINKLVKKYGA